MCVLFFWQYFWCCYRSTIHGNADLNLLRDATCVAVLSRNGVNQRCAFLCCQECVELCVYCLHGGHWDVCTYSRRIRKIAKNGYYFRHVYPHGTTRLEMDGLWNLIFEYFFGNLSKKNKFHYILARITGTLHEDLCILIIILWSILLRMRNVSDKT